MIDIHSHIFPNVDDGPETMEDSIKMLQQAYDAGITTIIATPHYIEDKYITTKKQREGLVNSLQKELDKKCINIKLYVGTEAYICTNLDELLKKKTISTLNNSKYVLFELPMHSKVIYLDEVVNTLLERKWIPIIAHPERYSYIQQDIRMVNKLLEKGVLFQANYGSICGLYGKAAQKTLKKLLKMDAIHFLASDSHRPDSIYVKTDKMLRKIERIIGAKKMDQLTQINPSKILHHWDGANGFR